MAGPDLSITNSIIQAFLAGQGLAQDRKDRAERAERDKLDREERKKAQDQAVKQFEQTFKAEQSQRDIINKATSMAHELAKIKALQEIQGQTMATGMTPPGFKQTTSESAFQEPGYAGTVSSYAPVDNTSGIGNLENIPDPISAARQQADVSRIALAPKTEAEAYIKQLETESEKAKLLQTQHFTEIQNQKNRDNAREIARIRAAASNNDPFKKLEVHKATPLSTADLEKYHVPTGTTYGQIEGMVPGLKLTIAQQNKIDFLNDMLSDAMDAETLLNKDKGGVGYENYFYGREGFTNILSGMPSEGLAKLKGENSESLAAIRNKLGSTFDKRKIESAGKVLSAAELQGLRNYVPPYEHTTNPIQAKVNLEQFIIGVKALKDKLESEYAQKPAPGTGKPETTEERIARLKKAAGIP